MNKQCILILYLILCFSSISDYRMSPGVKPNDDQFPLWGCSCAENCRMSAYARYEVNVDSDDDNALAPAPAESNCAPSADAEPEIQSQGADLGADAFAGPQTNSADHNGAEEASSGELCSLSSNPLVAAVTSSASTAAPIPAPPATAAVPKKANQKSKNKKSQKNQKKGPNPALQCCSSHSLYHNEEVSCAYDLNRCVKYGLGVNCLLILRDDFNGFCL